jgi:transglutaminase-like putative cysteine protease
MTVTTARRSGWAERWIGCIRPPWRACPETILENHTRGGKKFDSRPPLFEAPLNSRTLSTMAILGCVLAGAVCVALRYHSLNRAQIAREESFWLLTYEVKFDANPVTGNERARLRLPMPFNTRFCEILDYSAIHSELNAVDRTDAFTGTRELILSTQTSGEYSASANFRFRLRPSSDAGRQPPLEELKPSDELRYLETTPSLPVDSTAVRDVVQQIMQGATDEERVLAIFHYCQSLAPGDTESVGQALQNKSADSTGRARTMVALCRAARVPARLVTGFEIKQARGRLAKAQDGASAAELPAVGAQPHVWMEAYLDQKWVPFDPTYGFTYSTNFLPVRRGSDEVLLPNGNIDRPSIRSAFSITRFDPAAQVTAASERHPLDILELTRLPVPMHKIMKILLLLPFAALITTFMRNVVGLGTFGTFSPALLAMSFIYADLTTGLAILVIVMIVGLFGRKFLERLRLLMVPRLSIILTMVILCVVFGVSTLHYLLPAVSAEVVLLPMIILTMLIERFHVTAEEDGLAYTVQLALGTLLVAVLCYLVLRWDRVGSTVLTYPETHFFTIALFIMLGRYAGYRLTELWRFRDLVEQSEPIR